MPRLLARTARGVSLVELLVGMIIALMVLGIALQLTLIARARYQRLADEALIEDRGMRALELIGNAVRQAGWITDAPALSSVRRWPTGAPPSLFGVDDCDAPKGPPNLKCGGNHAEQRSDALMVHFAGRSQLLPNGKDAADGAMLNCVGYGVPERTGGDDDPRLGSMLLYVTVSKKDGERAPRLMCRSFKSETTPPTEGQASEIVRGVEILQLLYTLAPTPASPEMTVSARNMSTEDWYRVQRVHVAIVVRGNHNAMRVPASDKIALFRELGSAPNALTEDLYFQPKDPRRNRARFYATFAVRNPLRCEVDAC